MFADPNQEDCGRTTKALYFLWRALLPSDDKFGLDSRELADRARAAAAVLTEHHGHSDPDRKTLLELSVPTELADLLEGLEWELEQTWRHSDLCARLTEHAEHLIPDELRKRAT